MIIFHVIVASFSLIYSGFVLFFPSKPRLQIAYGLVAVTLASGFYLAWTIPAHITQTCITGLIYLAVVALEFVGARRRLAISINK
jgi:hypothetical protein